VQGPNITAIAFLEGRPDIQDRRIGGLGLSVGGELMIEGAASNPSLRAVVSERAGERSVRESALIGARGVVQYADGFRLDCLGSHS
jgi:uncharacterized protein